MEAVGFTAALIMISEPSLKPPRIPRHDWSAYQPLVIVISKGIVIFRAGAGGNQESVTDFNALHGSD